MHPAAPKTQPKTLTTASARPTALHRLPVVAPSPPQRTLRTTAPKNTLGVSGTWRISSSRRKSGNRKNPPRDAAAESSHTLRPACRDITEYTPLSSHGGHLSPMASSCREPAPPRSYCRLITSRCSRRKTPPPPMPLPPERSTANQLLLPPGVRRGVSQLPEKTPAAQLLLLRPALASVAFGFSIVEGMRSYRLEMTGNKSSENSKILLA
ncbi:hypothetical protein DR999_PMT16695 [Platysternon megacephalum]|uniref:Uncharacterized protein n=1 Tax=Platysternon megacephalum TaxID=55544 RepID=A0A4D9DTK2_9SAUR|nr:hypothetical protein DR999_PMT16695 [Platysternon megacephalum]